MISIGIMGCANIARRSILPTLMKHPDFKIAAIASRFAEKAKENAEVYHCIPMSYQQLVVAPEIDAIYIPLPTGLHYRWCLEALEHGKHVICEKSLAASYNHVEELVSVARQQRCALMETFQFRFHRQNLWVRDYIRSGKLGTIRCFRSSFGFPSFVNADNIRLQAELGGGALLDAGAYTLRALSFVLNNGFQVQSAVLRTPPDQQVDFGGGIFLSDPNGCVAELAFGFDNFYQCNYELWGTEAKITVQRAFTAPANFKPDILIERQGEQERPELEPDDHFFNQFTEFARLIKKQEFEPEYAACLHQAALLRDVATRSSRIQAK